MRKLLVIFVLLVSAAHAQVFNISAGSSTATIQSTLNSAAAFGSSATVNFAAGNYTITSQLTLNCPAHPMTITGPNTGYPQNYTARPTAHIINGLSDQPTVHVVSCAVQRSWLYTDMDGNQPSTGGGAFIVDEPQSNFTWIGNYLHGNEEIYPEPCDNSVSPTLCQYGFPTSMQVINGVNTLVCVRCKFYTYDDQAANLINLTGANDGTFTDQQNILIQYNIFGNPNQTYPLNQWVYATTANLGVASSNGDCVNVQQYVQSPGPTGANGGYGSSGGQCVAVAIRGGTTNLQILDNVIQNQEQGLKFFSCGSSNSTICVQKNDVVARNDISGVHRIFLEAQQSPFDGTTANFTIKNNSIRNPKDPGYGQWALSVPQGGQWRSNTDSNLLMSDCGNAANPNFCHQGTSSAGGVEYWGSNFASANYNLMQGTLGAGVQWGFGGYTGGAGGCTNAANCWQANNNTCQGSNIGTGGNPGICVKSEGEQKPPGVINVPAILNTVVGNPTTSFASPTPSISPAGGSFSGSQVVTLNANQFASSTSLPQGNVNIWYTTDGSTPGPHSGTSTFYTGPFTITSTTTVKAIGMWGGIAQPASYTTNYGFVPSSQVSATFTGGGTPTAATPVFTPPTEGFTGTITVTAASSTPSSSLFCTTNGSTPTPSSAPYPGGGFSVSSTTTLKCVATASGFLTSAVGTGVYTLGAPTLTSMSMTCAFGTILVGGTSQCAVQCFYSNSTNDVCTNGDGTSTPTYSPTSGLVATISSSALVTGVSAGSVNVFATVGAVNSNLVPITVNPALVTTKTVGRRFNFPR